MPEHERKIPIVFHKVDEFITESEKKKLIELITLFAKKVDKISSLERITVSLKVVRNKIEMITRFEMAVEANMYDGGIFYAKSESADFRKATHIALNKLAKEIRRSQD